MLIFPSASGCLAIASTAFEVAIPIPTPAPIPVKTATHAPIANNVDLIVSPFSLFILKLLSKIMMLKIQTHMPGSIRQKYQNKN